MGATISNLFSATSVFGPLAEVLPLLAENVVRPELIALLLVLLLLLRRRRAQVDLTRSADNILSERFKRGEISEEVYRRILDRTHQAV